MKLTLEKNGTARVVEEVDGGERSWSTTDARHTALHIPTWEHGDAARSQLSSGDRSALRDLANEQRKQRAS